MMAGSPGCLAPHGGEHSESYVSLQSGRCGVLQPDHPGKIQGISRVPLIDHNPRRGAENIEFEDYEAERYKARNQAERLNSHLKDHHGGHPVWVRGHAKVFVHLMFGVLAIAAEQILRFST